MTNFNLFLKEKNLFIFLFYFSHESVINMKSFSSGSQ